MYNFIFFVLYKANIKSGHSSARFQATLITFFAIFLHVALVVAIMKKMFPNYWGNTGFAFWFGKHKIVYLLIMVIPVILVYLYYNSRKIDRILNKYAQEGHPTKATNILKVVLMLLIPIIAGAIILSL